MVLSGRHKVDLAISVFANVNRISTAAKFQKHHILQSCSYGIGMVAQYAVSQCGVCEVELFLSFQDFFPFQIIPGAAVQ